MIYSADGITWVVGTNDFYFKTMFEKVSSAFDLNVCSQGDSVCESKTYDIDALENGSTYTITPSNAPIFYSGDNNVYFMMHSDSAFENKTPSMMASLSYTFDKPTTSLTRTKGNTDNTEIITLTCTNGTTGNCNNTYYSYNGVNYFIYASPITLSNGTYSIKYYSTADNNNIESINTTSFTIPIQGGNLVCGIVSLFPTLLIIIIFFGSGLFITGKLTTSEDMNDLIKIAIMVILGIIILVTITPILCTI